MEFNPRDYSQQASSNWTDKGSVESHAQPKWDGTCQQMPFMDLPATCFLTGKPLEKPKRALSAYNLFFQHERQHILKDTPVPVKVKGEPRQSHGKIGFASLARNIAAKWKAIYPDTKERFDAEAAKEKERYNKEMKSWRIEQRKILMNDGGGPPNATNPLYVYSGKTGNQHRGTPPTMHGVGSIAPVVHTAIHNEPTVLELHGHSKVEAVGTLTAASSIAALAQTLDFDCQELLMSVFRDFE